MPEKLLTGTQIITKHHFHVAAHRLMNRTAHDLGLDIIDFIGGFLFGNHDIAYLRGTHMRPWEFTGDKSPYNLRPEEKYKTVQELGWYVHELC